MQKFITFNEENSVVSVCMSQIIGFRISSSYDKEVEIFFNPTFIPTYYHDDKYHRYCFRKDCMPTITDKVIKCMKQKILDFLISEEPILDLDLTFEEVLRVFDDNIPNE